MSTLKSRSVEYWARISQERARKRKEKLASGKLVIGIDNNGKPITLPKRIKHNEKTILPQETQENVL